MGFPTWWNFVWTTLEYFVCVLFQLCLGLKVVENHSYRKETVDKTKFISMEFCLLIAIGNKNKIIRPFFKLKN